MLTFPKAWLASLREGELVHFRDSRGLRRELRILRHERDAVQAEAQRRAFVVEESRFHRVGFEEGVLPLALPHIETPIRLAIGDVLLLTRSLTPGRPVQRDRDGRTLVPAQIGCTEPNVFSSVKPGHRVLLDDGKFEAETLKVEPEQLHLRIHAHPGHSASSGLRRG